MNTSTTESGGRAGTRAGRGRARAILSRWPAAVGVLAAVSAFLAGPDRTTVGIVVVVAVAATCYLAAAATGRPWTAWVTIPGASALIVVGGLLGVGPMTTLAVIAGVLVVAGLIVRVSRATLTAEAAAALGYGGLVVLGLAIAPTAGLVLVAVTLVAHAAWDAVHLRRGIVVPQSLAEFCIALDVLLGLAVLLGLLLT